MVGAGEVPDVALRSLSRLTDLRTFECNSILRFTGVHFWTMRCLHRLCSDH